MGVQFCDRALSVWLSFLAKGNGIRDKGIQIFLDRSAASLFALDPFCFAPGLEVKSFQSGICDQ